MKAVLLGISTHAAIITTNEIHFGDDYHEDLTDQMLQKVGHIEPEYVTTVEEEEQLFEEIKERRWDKEDEKKFDAEVTNPIEMFADWAKHQYESLHESIKQAMGWEITEDDLYL